MTSPSAVLPKARPNQAWASLAVVSAMIAGFLVMALNPSQALAAAPVVTITDSSFIASPAGSEAGADVVTAPASTSAVHFTVTIPSNVDSLKIGAYDQVTKQAYHSASADWPQVTCANPAFPGVTYAPIVGATQPHERFESVLGYSGTVSSFTAGTVLNCTLSIFSSAATQPAGSLVGTTVEVGIDTAAGAAVGYESSYATHWTKVTPTQPAIELTKFICIKGAPAQCDIDDPTLWVTTYKDVPYDNTFYPTYKVVVHNNGSIPLCEVRVWRDIDTNGKTIIPGTTPPQYTFNHATSEAGFPTPTLELAVGQWSQFAYSESSPISVKPFDGVISYANGSSCDVGGAPIESQDGPSATGDGTPPFVGLTQTKVDAAASTSVEPNPVLTYAAGDLVTYRITYTNGTGSDITVPIIRDDLPPTAGMTYVSSSPAGTNSFPAYRVAWTDQVIPANSAAVYTVVARVTAATPAGYSMNCVTAPGYAGPLQVNHAFGTFLQGQSSQPSSPSAGSCANIYVAPLLPSVTQDKTVDKATAQPGETITYTISYANAGPGAYSGSVIETPPAGITYVSSAPAATIAGNGNYVWNGVSLPAGGSWTATVTATVNAGAFDATLINGVRLATPPASITVNHPCVAPMSTAWSCAATETGPQPAPALAQDKTVDKAAAVPGDTLTYTLTYANSGTAAYSGTVNDQLPAGVQFVSASPAPTSAGAGSMSWGAVSIPAGGTWTATVIGTVAPDAWSATLVNSTWLSAPPASLTVANPCTAPMSTASSCAVTVTPAQPQVCVGDLVWNDLDRDGIQDAGEPGIAGVAVALTGPTGLAVLDVDGAAVAPAQTDGSGLYSFCSLPALPPGQRYTVTVDGASPALAGMVSSPTGGSTDTGLDSSTGSAQSGDLTVDGASDVTLDFGFNVPPVVIPAQVCVGDYVWLDLDGDGIQDGNEAGIAGVSLSLTGPGGSAVLDIDGVPVAPAVTDADGAYRFCGLPALPAGRHYTVTVDAASPALSGLAASPAGAGGDAELDSSTGTAVSGDLTEDGDSDMSLDFGFHDATPPAAAEVCVGDFVWNDLDRDGVQDAGEPGIAGVSVTLTGPGGAAVVDVDGNPVAAAVTDADGIYGFCDLPALPAGEHYTAHVDGSQPALGGYVSSPANVGGSDSDSGAGSAESIDLTLDGARDDSLDFGFNVPIVPEVCVGDYVWNDADRDGIQDVGEVGIAGVTVTLAGPGGGDVVDVDGNPVAAAVTDADGVYGFCGLPALPAGEHYTVAVDAASPALSGMLASPAGQGGDGELDSSTGSADSSDLTQDGDSDITLDFGFNVPLVVAPAQVCVGDLVWSDLSGDGVQDAGEPGIAGVAVILTGPGGGEVVDVDGNPVAGSATDANGVYGFCGLPALPAGEHYTVTVAAPSGMVPSPASMGDAATDSSTGSAESGDLTVDGDSDPTLDFGFVTPAEPEVPSVCVTGSVASAGLTVLITGPNGAPVVGVDGSPVVSTVSGEQGSYSFCGLPVLPEGSYEISVKPAFPAPTESPVSAPTRLQVDMTSRIDTGEGANAGSGPSVLLVAVGLASVAGAMAAVVLVVRRRRVGGK